MATNSLRVGLSLLAFFFGWLPCIASRAAEPDTPPQGEIRLASGRVVNYAVHFDRNSLRDSVRAGDRLIALTSSGTLLGFALPGLTLASERISSEQVTCLGRGEGDVVFAGLADGRVCRVDPTTLELTDVVKLPSAPHFIAWSNAAGTRAAGLVVVTRPSKTVEVNGRLREQFYAVVNDLVTRKTFEPEHKVDTLLPDRACRLWLGADMGEWGGRVTRIDLLTGIVSQIKPPPGRRPGFRDFWEGVYGFVELRDGQVWAFGGSSHMGFNAGSIVRVDGAKAEPLFSFERPPQVQENEQPRPEPAPSRPRMPITHVVDEGGDLIVVSYSDVFRANRQLTSWKLLTTLDLQYRWGRPDAVGAYPSVHAVHLPGRPGEPYVFATVGDGYLALHGSKVIPHAVPGQLGAAAITSLRNTSEGLLGFEGDDESPVWRLGARGWEIAALEPPVEIDAAGEAADFERDQTEWYETHFLVGRGGMIYTVSAIDVTPGTRVTAQRVAGKSVRLGRETSSLSPSASFLTGDGTLWNCGAGELKRFEKGLWKDAATKPIIGAPDRLEAIAMTASSPPWLLIDRETNSLWRLVHGPHWENVRLLQIELLEEDRALRINDAIPWAKGTLLLATDVGLRAFDPSATKVTRVDVPEPPEPADKLVRDEMGRLWLGGRKGLWKFERGKQALEAFDRVPWLGGNTVYGLARDPQHEDGIAVALGRRGVAFVRATD